ncbi:MAG: hypothetical protein IKT53_06070 [Bacteroidaceae bacterium]|nr:hypothetical protein [Bacteroidaceae bacterium]
MLHLVIGLPHAPPPQAPMLAIVFYRPSYSHIFISIHRRSAHFGKSDRHTHRLATPFTGMQISVSTFFIAFAESTPLCDIAMCKYLTHADIAGIAIIPTPSPNGA